MPTIRTPDGRRLRVPDGATQEQISAVLQSQGYGAPRPIEHVGGEARNPTEGMGFGRRFAAGFGKAYSDAAQGAKQLQAETASNQAMLASSLLRRLGLTGPADFLARNVGIPSEQRRQTIQREVDETKQRDAPLMRTGGGFTGNVAGNVSQVLLPGAALRGTTASRALLPTTVAGNVAQGSALGALQPVASDESRGTNAALGGVGGGLGALAAKGAGATVSALSNLYRSAQLGPSTASAGRQLLREADNADTLLQAQPSQVPGVQRTLGEESLDPGVMALENTLRGPQAAQFAPRERASNLARVQALQDIAGDETSIAAAQEARDVATSELRERAFAEGDEIAKQAAEQRMLSPGMLPNSSKDALRSQFQSIAAGQGGRSAVQRSLNEVVSELERAPSTIQGLYRVRKSINDLIEGKAGTEKGYAKAATAELMQARNMLDAEIAQNLAPSFGDYLGEFRRMSGPINRMQVGQEILERGAAPVPDEFGVPRLTAGQFSRTAGNLDAAAQRATGFKKAQAADILSADDLKLIASIQDDLQRSAAVGRATGGGSQTSARQEILRRGSRTLAGALGPMGSVLEGLQRIGADQVQERLAYLLANPAEARRVLQALQPAQRSAVNRALLELSAQTTRATGTGAGVAQ